MTVSQGPVSPEIDSVIVHAEGLLETVNQRFLEAGIDLPGRQYINIGALQDAAWDCEQVVVSVEQLYNGLPGEQGQTPTRCELPWTAVSTVSIVRCLPTSTPAGRSGAPVPPTSDRMTEDAKLRMRDMWLLRMAGASFAEEQNYAGGLADITTAPPQGGYRAVILTLVAALV